MQRGWRLPTPDLIISVTGGGKQCNMSTHLRKAFQRGLVAAAATTSKTKDFIDRCFFLSIIIDAWLITAGTNAGVIKEVGKALNNYRYKNRKHALDVPCIGIGSWKHTSGIEQLDRTLRASLSVILENEISSSSHTPQSFLEALPIVRD
jgi:transient receptor potential cation channel subfamily M protein 2